MRKKDLVQNISDKTGISKVDVFVAVEQILKEIQLAVKSGESVYLRGFGTFRTKLRKGKTVQNIAKRCAMQMADKTIPFFKPSKFFKELL